MSRALTLVAAALFGSACGMFAEPPTDEEMTTRFRRDRAAFESLVDFIHKTPARGPWPLTREGLEALDVEPAARDVLRAAFDKLGLHWIKGAGDGELVFVTWTADIPGPGHHARGFAWALKPPRGQPREEGRASYEEYKALEGNWYLFGELID